MIYLGTFQTTSLWLRGTHVNWRTYSQFFGWHHFKFRGFFCFVFFLIFKDTRILGQWSRPILTLTWLTLQLQTCTRQKPLKLVFYEYWWKNSITCQKSKHCVNIFCQQTVHKSNVTKLHIFIDVFGANVTDYNDRVNDIVHLYSMLQM